MRTEAVLRPDSKLKAVMHGGAGVVLVTASPSREAPWQTCPREVLRAFWRRRPRRPSGSPRPGGVRL